MKRSRPICDYDIVIWLAAFVFGYFYEQRQIFFLMR